MRAACLFRHQRLSQSGLLRLASAATLAFLIAGCGGGGAPPPTPVPSNTAVTLFASSTANDQIAEFSITLNSLTLTNQAGKSVQVLSKPVSDEFMHLNGAIEPLVTLNVPPDRYISATATISLDLPTCVGQDPTTHALLTDETLDAAGSRGTAVTMPQPVTVGASPVALTLNLQVSATAPFAGPCELGLTMPVAPVFTLMPLNVAAQPTNASNGKAMGVHGVIASISATDGALMVNSLFAANAGFPPTWKVALGSSTVFQGVSGQSQLQVGMALDMDLAVQTDGSLLATRISVPDTSAANLSVATGPPIFASSTNQKLDVLQVEQAGNLPSLAGSFGYSGATFEISPQFTNLQRLPFSPMFSAATTVNGQNILYTAHSQDVNGFAPNLIPATTMTLIPQTVDGKVTAIASDGGFTTYTISLASYDLFANLAVQPGQTTLVTTPSTIVVYADSNTQMLNSNAVAVGNVFRFNGLVFDDNGSLRMDCAEIYDGVAQ